MPSVGDTRLTYAGARVSMERACREERSRQRKTHLQPAAHDETCVKRHSDRAARATVRARVFSLGRMTARNARSFKKNVKKFRRRASPSCASRPSAGTGHRGLARSRRSRRGRRSPAPNDSIDLSLVIDSYLGRFQSDFDDGECSGEPRTVRVRLRNIDRPHPTPSQPLSKFNGIPNRYCRWTLTFTSWSKPFSTPHTANTCR